jgi:hypothetical protein
MLAAGLSIAVMIGVLFVYGLRGDAPVKPSSESHTGAQHHRAEPHEGDKAWALPAFVDARVGDWIAFEATTQLANARPQVTAELVTVEAVDDKQVTLVRSERENSLDPPQTRRTSLPRQGITIDQLFGNDQKQWTLFGLAIRDESHEVSGRSFEAKRVSYSLIDPLAPTKRAQVELWVSPAVPLDGIVELRQIFEGTSLSVTRRLIGFGTAEAITWGKKPDGL